MDSLFQQLMDDPWGRLILHYLLSSGLSNWASLVLVGGRFVGLFFVAPQLVNCPIPYSIRIGLVVVLSLVVAPVVAMKDGPQVDVVQLAHQTSAETGVSKIAADIGGFIMTEVALGTLLGVCVLTILSGLKMAGNWLERHSGLGQGSVINPDWSAGDSACGTFVALLGVSSLFLLDPMGGHWPILRSLLHSFQEIPIGAPIGSLPLSRLLSTVLSQSMILGLRLAMPLLVTMSFIDATLAFANRTGPQLATSNYMVVRLVVGMIALALTMTTIPDVISAVFHSGLDI